jgi:4-aminobutyrate aminotransferase
VQTAAGNPIATAAGRVVLRLIQQERLAEQAAHTGALLAQGLHELSTRHSMLGEVRGRGLALGVELVRDRVARDPVPVSTTAKVILRAYPLGVVLFQVGLRGNALEFTPPLTLMMW